MSEVRAVRPDEMHSLSRLEDTVFMPDGDRRMFPMFPQLFAESNLENLLVVEQDGEIVSHVGMTLRYANILGCTLRVACVGAVATYEECRGQGMATRLLDAAREKCRRDGVDLMLISGGRGMYLRAGATHVGLDHNVEMTVEQVEGLRDDTVTVAPFEPPDRAACVAAYAGKPVHFVRPRDDWDDYITGRYCCCRQTRFMVIRHHGRACGYFVAFPTDDQRQGSVAEFAGDVSLVTAALHPLMRALDATSLRLHLQASDGDLLDALRDSSTHVEPSAAQGTLLLINSPQLMAKLAPIVEQRAGIKAARAFRTSESDGRYTFALGDQTREAADMPSASHFIFGHPEADIDRGTLAEVFPIPALWYGLNYA